MNAASLPESAFLPSPATLEEVSDLTPDVRLFKVRVNPPATLPHQPGQFAFVSAFGIGESPITFASAPNADGHLEFAIRRVGSVTRGLHLLEPGATLGVRGPFGKPFPLDSYKGKKILIIGGGIGMAPLRPLIQTILGHRDDYGALTIINGARSPADLVFKSEFDQWASAPQTELFLTVDRGDQPWTGRVALIPDLIAEMKPKPEGTMVILCGPPIMIHLSGIKLKELGFAPSQMATTLESKMKCGMGKCARCNVGNVYICKDGPVFTFQEIAQFLEPF